ncbi:PAS domain-containing protein [Hydrogenophaga sp. XSHU_21]
MNTLPSPSDQSALRQRAAAVLDKAQVHNGQPLNASEALGVLFQLASSPTTAKDALAVLHELQVHQVELELQREDLAMSRGALEDALARQTFLFDHAPVGYLDIDASTVVRRVNHAALRLLGVSRLQLQGSPINSSLDPASQERLQAMLARAKVSMPPQTQALHLRSTAGVGRMLFATVDRDESETGFLLALMGEPPTELRALGGGGGPTR